MLFHCFGEVSKLGGTLFQEKLKIWKKLWLFAMNIMVWIMLSPLTSINYKRRQDNEMRKQENNMRTTKTINRATLGGKV